jgi:hypothetical protein
VRVTLPLFHVPMNAWLPGLGLIDCGGPLAQPSNW